METLEHTQINSRAIERGYKNCRSAVKSFFRGHLWPASNLPGEQRHALDPILYNLMRTIDLLDLESADGRSLDVWFELRDELSDAFGEHGSSVELAALADAARRFEIPKQFLFDPLRGADLWIRNQQFECFDELDSFCSYVGGSTLASIMPVLGTIKTGYEVEAIQCGKAMMLTRLLAHCVRDIKHNKIFLAQKDLADCKIDMSLVKLRRPSPSFRHLVRLYVSRIEKLFHSSRELGNYLDFDGKRTLKSLISVHWKMLLKMQAEPETVLAKEGVLSKREQLILQSRHLMGIEKDIPVFVDSSEPH